MPGPLADGRALLGEHASNQGGRVQPYAAWSRPARRHGRPGSWWSARSQPALVPNTAPASWSRPWSARRAAAVGRRRPRRTDSAAGSSREYVSRARPAANSGSR